MRLQESAINKAIGEATAITRRAAATSESISMVSATINKPGGADAVSYHLAQQYIAAFGSIAGGGGNTMILPADASDVVSMVARATSVFGAVSGAGSPPQPPPPLGHSSGQSGARSSSGDRLGAGDAAEARRGSGRDGPQTSSGPAAGKAASRDSAAARAAAPAARMDAADGDAPFRALFSLQAPPGHDSHGGSGSVSKSY